MIIYVDIDETICEHPNTDPSVARDYERAIPIFENINKINNLFDSGDTIIYWTARGANSGLNWGETTKNQLQKWGAKPTELKMGKPHYDLFICDKAINTERYFQEKNDEVR